jgi:hypothetical protein
MSKKEMLFKKIKAMDLEEILPYYAAARITNLMVNLIGIGIILAIFMFASPLVYVPGVLVLYVMARQGASLGEVLDYIEERIAHLSDNQINS